MEAGFAAVIAAFVLPLAVLLFMRSRRHGKFAAQFPDAMDIIVRSLRAGHPVPVAVGLVAQEMPDPIGTEFGIAADEITYGADVEAAMRNLYFRVGQEDLPLFVTAVSIQGSTGGNLSEILENLSRVIRERFKMRRKIKALAAEGKFSALFLSGLPVAIFLLLQVVAPNFYGIVWNQSLTKMGLGLAGTWMVLGNIVMYKMCSFRI
jgi:tight adherence protein B